MAREKEKADISATGLQRLLRRMIPDSQADVRHTYRELMEASERRLASAAASDNPAEQLVAVRLRGCPQEYQRWEEEHTLLMKRVASERGADAQKNALLSAALALIHRKALFEYLRDRHICGGDRQRLLAHFHGGNDYANAFVQEHANYLRSTASYLCVRHAGRRLLQEPAFGEPLSEYEETYAEYFAVFCEVALVRAENEESNHSRSLLIPLKQRVNEARSGLLGPSAARSGAWKKLPTPATQ